MPQDLTDDKSTLVQVKATSHYPNQCWPRSPTPYGVTRPQWVNKSYTYIYLHTLQVLYMLGHTDRWMDSCTVGQTDRQDASNDNTSSDKYLPRLPWANELKLQTSYHCCALCNTLYNLVLYLTISLYTDHITGGELRNGVNGFLSSYPTDSVRFSQQILYI